MASPSPTLYSSSEYRAYTVSSCGQIAMPHATSQLGYLGIARAQTTFYSAITCSLAETSSPQFSADCGRHLLARCDHRDHGVRWANEGHHDGAPGGRPHRQPPRPVPKTKHQTLRACRECRRIIYTGETLKARHRIKRW
ncbi:hypothetical protein HPB48_004560 [Haemaphysalis longicornis]|uniref:Uncharacterized protein n=1 Tax=Haemaphysalis longicornis TaxID=44386 RepID=A0A9J6GUH5_HAELO|nr:hypothetical protein HPB48_004560 [Haemaphysalis longicornis]